MCLGNRLTIVRWNNPQGQRRPRFSFSDSLVKERRVTPETHHTQAARSPAPNPVARLEKPWYRPNHRRPSQRSGASRAPSCPCQPRQSSKPDHPTNTKHHPKDKNSGPSSQSRIIHPITPPREPAPPPRPKSRWPPPMNRLLRAHSPTVNGQMTGKRNFRDESVIPPHTALET